ncbi:MAG TPA: type II secretion system protein GspJ [Gammaproteobacteria bacterium]|nr:type II secretion system protein GspJ [Gammaproteobacteria bacterium]
MSRARVACRAAGGFTLLELLVSLSIFALVAAMAYGGLQSVLNTQDQTEQQSQRMAQLQLVYRLMQRDLEQLVDRGIRNEFGDPVGALVGGSGYDGVEFTRGGHPNPAGFLRSDLLRVAYVPDQDTLLRRTWRVLDRSQDSQPDEQVLVEHMQSFRIRFLGQNREWQDRWPPPRPQQQNAPADLPLAVEVQLELDGIGTLNWDFLLPQVALASQKPLRTGGTGANGGRKEDGKDNASGENEVVN